MLQFIRRGDIDFLELKVLLAAAGFVTAIATSWSKPQLRHSCCGGIVICFDNVCVKGLGLQLPLELASEAGMKRKRPEGVA